MNIVIIQVQKQIHLASAWFTKWRLKLNVSKTEAVLFNRKIHNNDINQLVLNNTPLKWSKNVQYLGVIIDRHLNFFVHMYKILQRLLVYATSHLNLLKLRISFIILRWWGLSLVYSTHPMVKNWNYLNKKHQTYNWSTYLRPKRSTSQNNKF